jgi:hypothetical protein
LTPEQLAAEEAADQEAYELDRAAVERFVESGEDAKARKVAARWDGLPEIAERLIAARADPLFISAPTQSEEAQPAKVEHEFRFPKWKFTEEKEGAGESEAQAKAAAQEVVKVEAKVESAPKAVPKQTPEVALRLATVVAFYRRSPVVEVEDLEWGIPLARLSCAEIERGLSKHQLEELAQADVCDLIRGLFRNSLGNRKHPGVLTHGYIRRTCERKVKDLGQVDKAIAQLLLTEEIVAYDDSGPGRPAQKWKWQSRE